VELCYDDDVLGFGRVRAKDEDSKVSPKRCHLPTSPQGAKTQQNIVILTTIKTSTLINCFLFISKFI
jgi:predicted secreted protein